MVGRLKGETDPDAEAARDDLIALARRLKPDYEPAWFHREVARELEAFERGDAGYERLILCMPPQHGKALALDELVPTPDGWRRMGDLTVGDRVFDDAGRPTEVVAVSPTWRNRACFRVTLDSGESLVVDEAHEWVVRMDRKRPWVRATRETRWLAARVSRSRIRAPMVDHHPGLDLAPADLPIDPYTLGYWLGDGAARQATIACDRRDQAHVRARIGLAFPTTDHRDPQTFGVLGLRAALRAIGVLGQKRLPAAYLRGSAAQRLALLQGLVDSDGYVAPDGQVEFCSTDEALARAVRELVISLGAKAQLLAGRATLGGRDCGAKWRVMFYRAEAASLPRKAARCRSAAKAGHFLRRFEPVAPRDTVCIEVAAPSHLFLAGAGMIPTRNTELVSRVFPARLLGRNPDLRIIATSYSSTAASLVNLDVQRYIDSEAYASVFPATRLPAPGQVRTRRHRRERRSAQYFEVVGRRGYYLSAGRGTGISGRPADVGIIDDPIKDREEAESETVRKALWGWFTAALLTRLRKTSRILVVMTRWHEDDLVGRLLENARAGGPQWRVVRFPAIAETLTEYPRHPSDRRADGEALWPEQYPSETLVERCFALGSYQFDGMFQQRPTAPGGTEFKREHARYLPSVVVVPGARTCRAWDCGATEDGGDPTAGAKVTRVPPVAQFPKGAYIVEDVRREQWGPAKVDDLVVGTAEQDGRHVLVREEQEPGSAGKTVVTTRGARLRERGYMYEGVPSTAAKAVRRLPARALWEAGLVYLVTAPWNERFLDELTRLPGGAHDDQSDAFACAVNTLAALPVGLGGAVPLHGHKTVPSATGQPGPTDRVQCSGGCGQSFPYQRMARVNGGVFCPSCEARAVREYAAAP